MKIKMRSYNDVTVVQLEGELDIESAEPFKKAVTELIDADRKGIVFDMSNVGFIDSAGLEQFLWVRDYCGQNHCQLRLAGLDENGLKIFEITRLADRFDHYGELAEAVKSFA